MHVELELLSDGLDVLKTLLVVGPSTTNPDLDLVLDELWSVLADSFDDTLESRCNVGEVGNTTSDEENFALRGKWCAEHKVEDSTGVVVSLGLGWSSRVLSVVGELVREASRCNGVGVDDGSATTSDEGPDTAGWVENGQLEGSTGLGVKLGDVGLLLGQLTTEWSRELHWWSSIDRNLSISSLDSGHAESSWRAGSSPLGTALELSGLIKLGSEIEEEDLGGGGILVWNDDQWVDLEVCELAVDVDGVEAGDEVDEDVVDSLWHIGQESRCDLLVRWVLSKVDWDEELLGLLIDVADIDTSLVCEENPITL